MSMRLSTFHILGIDPGLRRCGWGLVALEGHHLRHLAHGVICPPATQPLGQRLSALEQGLSEVMDQYPIHSVGVEQTFQNTNPQATLSLGMARGICLLVPTKRGLSVHDYAPNAVKKALVGKGHADKTQVAMMVRRLLGGVELKTGDETDALALAICHAHHTQFNQAVRI